MNILLSVLGTDFNVIRNSLLICNLGISGYSDCSEEIINFRIKNRLNRIDELWIIDLKGNFSQSELNQIKSLNIKVRIFEENINNTYISQKIIDSDRSFIYQVFLKVRDLLQVFQLKLL